MGFKLVSAVLMVALALSGPLAPLAWALARFPYVGVEGREVHLHPSVAYEVLLGAAPGPGSLRGDAWTGSFTCSAPDANGKRCPHALGPPARCTTDSGSGRAAASSRSCGRLG
jgi:hypothetical protein